MNIFLDVDYRMTFKPFKGYTLKEIYQYAPNYIERLITHTDEYFIDISQFENLPTPTPYEYKEKIQVIPGQGPFQELAVTGRDQIQDSLDYKAAGNTIPEKSFTFSERTRMINDSKKNGDNYHGIKFVSIKKNK